MSFDTLITYGWLGIFMAAWIGLSIGSFLNVVIYRYPIMLGREWREQATAILQEDDESEQTDSNPEEHTAQQPIQQAEEEQETFNLMLPRSRCPNCDHQITALENIPVLSWLFLRGKCSSCSLAISARYPGVELLTGVLTLAVIATFGFTWMALSACLATWILVAATFIDFDTKLLPDQLTYPILWLGLLSNGLFSNPIVPLLDAVVGAVIGYLFLWSTYWAFKLITGKEGMGYGDFKLFAALGAWMGWQALPSIILVAASLGLIYAVARILFAKQSSADPIAFGPFLAAAGWVTLVYRDSVLGMFAL